MLENFRAQKIIWDRASKNIFEKIEANSGDTNGRKLVAQVLDQGVTENLSGTTLSLGWKSRQGTKGLDAFNVVDASKGIFEIYYTTEMLSNIGNIEASLILIDSTSRIESSTFTISVRPSTVDDESVESENSFTALTEALVKVNDFDAQLAHKVEQDAPGVITWAMTAQDVRENITGGNTAVVGVDSVTTENVVNKAITLEKLGGFDDVIAPKTLAQNTGEFTSHVGTVSSTFKGWALPFQKSKFTGKITRIKVALSLTVASDIELGIGNTFNSATTLTKTLNESGFLEFDVEIDTSTLNDTFYIFFKNLSGNGLRFSSAIQGDYPTLSNGEFYFWTGTDWNGSTSFITYGISDIKIYTDYKLNYAMVGHTHSADDIEGLTLPKENMVKLSLPDKYDLVVGDKFELFYKGIVLANDPYIYNIQVESTKGKAFRRKYEYQPVVGDIGTQTVTVSLYDDNETLLDTKAVNLIVRAKAISPASQKNILLIGDSLISGGEFVNEAYRRLTQVGGTPSGDALTNIKFVGNRRTTLNAGYEGFGGWTYSNYYANTASVNIFWVTTTHDKTIEDQHSIYKDVNNVEWRLETIEATRIKIVRVSATGTLPASGTLTWVSGGANNSDIVFSAKTGESGNPFWNSALGKVDFINYASEQGVSQIDVCYILLGWNMSYMNEATFKAEAKYFIDKLKTDFPNVKIVLMGLQVPSIDGIGTNYGATWNYYDKLKFVFNLNKWYEDICLDYTGVEIMNVAGQFDTEYNMPKNEYYANTRTTTLEQRSNNGVHPSNDGYMQIADAVYRNIVAQITT